MKCLLGFLIIFVVNNILLIKLLYASFCFVSVVHTASEKLTQKIQITHSYDLIL